MTVAKKKESPPDRALRSIQYDGRRIHYYSPLGIYIHCVDGESNDEEGLYSRKFLDIDPEELIKIREGLREDAYKMLNSDARTQLQNLSFSKPRKVRVALENTIAFTEFLMNPPKS